MAVPETIHQVDDEWLREALNQPVAITSIERIGEGFGLASEIYRVALTEFEADTIAVKLWSFDGPADATEVHFYRELASDIKATLPTCFYAESGEERAVLILEDIAGRQGDVLVREPVSQLLAIATSLGRIHGSFWDDATLDAHEWLRNGWTGPSEEWMTNRPTQFISRFGPVSSSLGRNLMRDPSATLGAGKSLLAELPQTLVHGDLHLDNILFGDSPVILDWAGCRRGPGLQDLVSVIFTMGESIAVDPVLEAYTSGLTDQGVEVERTALEQALGGAVLWSFLFWTLGTAAWEPDDERGEAMQSQHHDDAIAMVEVWQERSPGTFEWQGV